MDSKKLSNRQRKYQGRSPFFIGAEGPLILYVLGYSWSALRMYLMQGPRRYFTVMWNWTEIIMLTLFWLSFVFWIMAALDELTTEENIGEDKLD